MSTQVEAEPTLSQKLQAFVGRQTTPPFRAHDPVNQPMIRHFCDAIGDANPVYTDPGAAAASRHGTIVAPPAMLQAWTMRGLRFAEPAPETDVMGQVFALLDEAGFTSIVATNSEQEYSRYLKEGDHLTRTGVIESISEEKKTGLGAGHFINMREVFATDDGEVVGRMLFRVLKFRPSKPPAAVAESAVAAAPRRPRPAISADNRFFWEGVDRGELLIQRCAGCGALRHPPRPMCPQCGSLQWDTLKASGRGTLHSYVVPHHPPLPMFPQPYIVALVDLEEGTRLVSNLVDVAPDEVTIGMPLELTIVAVDDELKLPLFRPATAAPEMVES
jgi:uncharacterized OB-fold protein/acyl dehydratase